jgi:biopolymer transport protein ExbD
MKLEMTLPERPGLLHAVPILNIFALMQLFFLLGPSLLMQSGVAVDLPPSRFQMDRYEESLVVTVSRGEANPFIHLGRDPVSRDQLAARLDELRAAGAQAKTIVLLQTAADLAVGTERDLTEMILSKGFRVAMVGKTPPSPAALSPAAE